jgi:hypothetical protein
MKHASWLQLESRAQRTFFVLSLAVVTCLVIIARQHPTAASIYLFGAAALASIGSWVISHSRHKGMSKSSVGAIYRLSLGGKLRFTRAEFVLSWVGMGLWAIGMYRLFIS